MSYEDRTLTCQDCEQPFTFSADDQQIPRREGLHQRAQALPRLPSGKTQRPGQ